jgi:hypothetical protein
VVAASLLVEDGDAARAARLLGAVGAFERDIGDFGDVELAVFDGARADVADMLGEEDASRALADGAAAGDGLWREALEWLEERQRRPSTP